ncbi:hypothetical protein H0A36_15815 [Endozoicomonas sp. SM1973]|uniref:Uncharacterized protein n=1 Tax=Spartinivicinus marinus TaxID=2994442 RepID=A0A853IBN8_9GAMM|nr:hypothetical protein [Spartinivicinus marinus]MCX4028405.1 hypothetical protein [Spartinivicinus marinus]NYZ67484.1 hypothetical protein [Spartinivicinus marinus]
MKNNNSFDDCYDELIKSRNIEFYGNKIKLGSIEDFLLKSIQLEKDVEKKRKALELYARSDFSNKLAMPSRLRGIIIYLMAVCALFLLLCFVYRVKVFPVFLEAFYQAGGFPIDDMNWFFESYSIALLGVILLLGVSLLITYQIGQLFHSHFSNQARLFIIPKSIKKNT